MAQMPVNTSNVLKLLIAVMGAYFSHLLYLYNCILAKTKIAFCGRILGQALPGIADLPIRFCFERETVDSTKAEKVRVDREIQNLVPSTFSFNGQQYTIYHTLLDCKICNAITDNKSTQRCYVCDLTSKVFNNIEKCLQVNVKKETFEFGLSILHAWIRLMECLLHLSYKIGIKKYQAREQKEKDIVAKRKEQIQTEVKNVLSLWVDKPK